MKWIYRREFTDMWGKFDDSTFLEVAAHWKKRGYRVFLQGANGDSSDWKEFEPKEKENVEICKG